MSNRITQKNLEGFAQTLNEVTGNPTKPYVTGEDGKLVAQIGCYHISYAYGGASLHRMAGEHGGVSDVFGAGHMPKRELWDRMHAFLRGYEAGAQHNA